MMVSLLRFGLIRDVTKKQIRSAMKNFHHTLNSMSFGFTSRSAPMMRRCFLDENRPYRPPPGARKVGRGILRESENKTIGTFKIEYSHRKMLTGMRMRVEGGENLMSRDVVEFRITNLDVYVPRGLTVMWRGYKIPTGAAGLRSR